MRTTSWRWPKKTVISRDDGSGAPYLTRYNFLELPFLSIKVHHIHQSDWDCPHDHPWSFLSIILKGGYLEWIPLDQPRSGEGWIHYLDDAGMKYRGKIFRAGSILYRPHWWIHRLQLCHTKGLYAEKTDTWTLVFTFRKVGLWGFWTRKGWVPDADYHAKNTCE